jgi:Acyltransferase family
VGAAEPGTPPSGTETGQATSAGSGSGRRAYLDNLKVILVAGVILGHAFITYGDLGSWAYREPSSSAVFNLVAAVVVSLGSLFAMGLFFLMAGLLTPGPLARKGPRGFLRERALRLGAPFLAYLLLFPMVSWAGGRGDHPLGWYLRAQSVAWDPGPLWFVGVLLLFSALFVGWRSRRPAPVTAGPMPGWVLPSAVGAVAVGTLLVRLVFPIDSYQLFAAHLWQWPQCLTLFLLGTTAAERGWLAPVATRQRRLWGAVALAGTMVVLTAIATAENADAFAGGATWQAALTAGCEGAIAIGLSVWLLGTFQHRFDHAGPAWRALARSAFGAYVLQAPVLVGIALLASALPTTPEITFLLVAPSAVAASFALAWLLTRVPGIRRIL